jgi:hypothetical protein
LGWEEIGKGYWYGMNDGCICNGDFGGDFVGAFSKDYKLVSNK